MALKSDGYKKIFGYRTRMARFCSTSLAVCLIAASLTGCGNSGSMEDVKESLVGTGGSETTADTSGGDSPAPGEGQSYTFAGGLIVASEMFTERDFSGEYDEEGAEKISLSGRDVTIEKEGVYLLSGTLAEGMVIVDAGKDDKIQLVLDGVEIDNNTNAAIYVKEADKVFITLAEGSENSLTGRGYTSLNGDDIDGVIFAKSDLVINGSGSLIVNAVEGHGIVSRDDLKITGGVVTVTAQEQGLSGRDSVRIGGGVIGITSGKDGIHAENDDDMEKGYVFLSGGELLISSQGDGISAGNVVQVDGGIVDITAGGGSGCQTVAVDENGDAVSTKGIKAAAGLAVNQGTFSINAQDDAIHSDLDVVINGGNFSLATGDDGIHANEMISITGGSIHISESYEGIEGNKVEISGGSIRLYAADDGINAAGGNDRSGFDSMFGGGEGFGSNVPGNRRFGNDGTGAFGNDVNRGSGNGIDGESGIGGTGSGEAGGDGSAGNGDDSVDVGSDVPCIWISGGVIYVRADGDGLDSNGNLLVSGGELYISGPEDSENGPLDYDGNAQITGGTVVAVGNGGMAMNFGNASTQGSILLTTADYSARTVISVQDSEGRELVSYPAECAFNSVVVSSPEMVLGGTYTIVTGDDHTEITLDDSLIYGTGFGFYAVFYDHV